ncbi:hypothetical protein [Streptomyces olivochromogenes]|uniref:IS110 family transposase n=1 Tax=Streptomyces olivochromogenes TaxID=1963 RepID=A0A250VRM3_STROL|nr:hypothetical protein [Streptomyces olivochromogenes]KUN42581.1 hypothetical protein AQJ27_35945 [Streptomyces olivochromogenes]GAX56620.1 IS110 family transposase [Streptomyces olivochromogenes]
MIQRLEKVLQDAGIKLTSVTSQAYSKSARAILDALVEEERDPKILASLVKGRLRSTRERLEEALGHRFRVEHRGVLARRLLAAEIGLDMSVFPTSGHLASTPPDGLQRLLNGATWDADDVRDDLQTYVAEKLGEDGGVIAQSGSRHLEPAHARWRRRLNCPRATGREACAPGRGSRPSLLAPP